MFAQARLLSSFQINPIPLANNSLQDVCAPVPVDSPVHTSCKCDIVAFSEADIEHRSLMLVAPDQIGFLRAIGNIVQVDVLVP